MSILPMVGFAGNRPADVPLLGGRTVRYWGAKGPPVSSLYSNRNVLDDGCCPKLNCGRSAPRERIIRKSLPVLVRNIFVSGRSGF